MNGAATLDGDLADLGRLQLALRALNQGHAGSGAHAGWPLDVDAPHPVRVKAPLRNLPEFARAFGCRPDTPMVVAPRCEVW